MHAASTSTGRKQRNTTATPPAVTNADCSTVRASQGRSTAGISAALCLLLLTTQSLTLANAASAPPAAMQQPNVHSPRALVDLVPSFAPAFKRGPTHAHQRRHMLSPETLLAVDQQRISHRARSAWQQLRGADLVAAAASNATNATRNSALNPSDKLTQLGFLGNAYNAALNLSSNTTGGSQLVFVQLDTASADLWVVSARCTKATSAACASEDIFRFDESKSGSYAPLVLHSGGANASSSAPSSASASNVAATATSSLLSALGVQATQVARHAEAGAGDLRPPQRRWADLPRLPGFGSGVPSSSKQYAAAGALHAAAAAPSPEVASSSSGQNGSTVPFSITYADSSVASGIVGVEDITFAELRAPRQAFGLVDRTTVTLVQQGIGGILGLGFPRGSAIARSLIGQNLTDSAVSNTSTSTPSTQPLMTSLLASSGSNASYPLFSLSFNGTGGRMSIGAVDPYILPRARDRALVDWHDVIPFPYGDASKPANSTANEEGPALGAYVYWAVPLAIAGVNGTSANITSSASAPYANYTGPSPLAIIDSGTRGILGPVAAVADLYSHIPSSRHVGGGQWVVPCDTTLKMHFGFGTSPGAVVRNLTLLPTQYLIGPASGNPNLCFSWVAASLDLPSTDGVGWTFGMAFLRSAYTIFSLGIEGKESPKVGFYPMDASLANLTAPLSADGAGGGGGLPAAAAATLFAPQPSQSVASWLANNATTIAFVLPNSLVPLPSNPDYYAQPTYAFASATASPTPGLVPAPGTGGGRAAGRPSYTPVITAALGDARVPVIANDTTVQPIPSNPAAAAAAAARGAARPAALMRTGLRCAAWTGAVLSLYFFPVL